LETGIDVVADIAKQGDYRVFCVGVKRPRRKGHY
jgi:hypothetical protein